MLKFKFYFISSFIFLIIVFVYFIYANSGNGSDIIIENSQFKLVFTQNGISKSLIHKKSGRECLKTGANLPAFSITQDMPYDNENKLTYPAKPITFYSDSLYRDGNKLIVSFGHTSYQAVIKLKITDFYIGFKLKEFRYKVKKIGIKRKTPIDRFTFLQLPIKDRKHFGEWLNVIWDNKVAVNLLATDIYCRIDAQKRKGYKILQAGGENKVRLTNVGAALIVTDRNKILDCIDKVEHDYNLPLGVQSRKNKVYKNSTLSPRGIITTKNIDEYIAVAKKSGLKQILIYYPSFATTTGHFNWRPEYPNGIDDLKIITGKIVDAGLLPGLHIHYNKATFTDSYVTPAPDGRLNIRRTFTLRNEVTKNSTTITVEENPYGCTLQDGRRILKIGTELISYEKYTTEPPYQFLNCKRGIKNTKVCEYKRTTQFGLLDVDTWPVFVRFNQDTDIQEEVAKRIAKLVDECGFRFIYFDGAEDVNRPYWYNITKAQLTLYNAIKNKPIFSEGAIKTHFGWHILTRGNAFDTFEPEDIKKATRMYPIKEIKLISNDFSSINFGWNNYVVPGIKTKRSDVNYKSPKMKWSTPIIENETTIGLQPDMLEYITSRAAAWNSPICLVGTIDVFKKHPRTKDNFEVIRRWELVRETNYLSQKQKEMLKNESQEHILLINGKGEFELLPYKQITEENSIIRAFIFNRKNKPWVVYWHISGNGKIKLPIGSNKMHLFKNIGEEISLEYSTDETVIPVGDRKYIQFELDDDEEVIDLFSKIEFMQ